MVSAGTGAALHGAFCPAVAADASARVCVAGGALGRALCAALGAVLGTERARAPDGFAADVAAAASFGVGASFGGATCCSLRFVPPFFDFEGFALPAGELRDLHMDPTGRLSQ